MERHTTNYHDYIVQLCVGANYHLLQEEASQLRAKQCTALLV